jgi:hypothetical protein
MSDLNHRVGVQEANLVVRHIKLENVNEKNIKTILAAIDQQFGIDNVNYDEHTSTLSVAYDVTHCSIDGIEEIIHRNNADIAHNWWSRFKESYYKFTEQNIKDNAEYEPTCCHKPPVRKK